MTIATGARSQVAYIAETTFGTTPASPTLAAIAFTGWNVNLVRDEYDDNSIRSDRMEHFSVSGNRHVSGDMDVNYSPLSYDDLLGSFMFNTWATNVLKVGTTPASFTVEEAALDITQYRVYTGVMVDKFSLTIPNNGVITAKFSLLGKDQSALTTSTISSGAVTAATAASPVTHTGATGYFKIGGSTVGYITSMTLNGDNGLVANYGLGSATTHGITPNFAKVSGTMSVFFEDAVFYNLFVNGTIGAVEVKLDNGTNQHDLKMGSVKFTGATKTINGNGPVTMSATFKALYNGGDASNLVITRS